MGLEHFMEGVGKDHIHLLGASGPTRSNSEASKLYGAEYGNQDTPGWVDSDPSASKQLTVKQAREFTAKVINHPAMDKIPGIENVRKNFDPRTDVVFSKKLWWQDQEGRPQTVAGMVTSENEWDGKSNRLIMNPRYFPNKKIPVGGLTHEIAHMIVNDSTFPNAGHNWAMARAHLHIVKHLLGEESHKALKKQYDEQGVNYG